MRVPIVSLAPIIGTVQPARNKGGSRKWTHCKRGHALVPGNLYYYADGDRACIACRTVRADIRSDHA